MAQTEDIEVQRAVILAKGSTAPVRAPIRISIRRRQTAVEDGEAPPLSLVES
jgi:hypothetical protein